MSLINQCYLCGKFIKFDDLLDNNICDKIASYDSGLGHNFDSSDIENVNYCHIKCKKLEVA